MFISSALTISRSVVFMFIWDGLFSFQQEISPSAVAAFQPQNINWILFRAWEAATDEGKSVIGHFGLNSTGSVDLFNDL